MYRSYKRYAGLALLLVVGILGAACGLRTGPSINEDAQSSSQNGRMEKGSSSTGTSIVKTGYVGSLSDAGIFIAIDNGYFEEQGIEVELQKFNTAGDAIPHLATGNLQVASGGVSPGLFNAVRQGIPIRIVADKGSLRRGQGFNVLVVRKDLFESGEIRRINDLKGKIVAIVEKSVAEYELYETLRQAGMSLSDVKVANVPYSEVPAALANKRVDAAITIEPFGTVAEEKGVGKILVTMDKVVPDLQNAAVYFSRDFIEKNRDLALKWMVAYLKGVRYYNDSLNDPGKRERVIQILMKYTGVQDRALYDRMIWPGLHPDGIINVKGMENMQQFWVSQGDQEAVVPSEEVIDLSLVEEARKVLDSEGD